MTSGSTCPACHACKPKRMRRLLAEAFPNFDAPLIETYKAMNGIILGKVNLAELSSTVTSINPNGPGCYSYNGVGCSTPLNAYNQTRIAGGEP